MNFRTGKNTRCDFALTEGGLQKLTSGQIKLGRQIKIRHFGMKTN